MLLCPEDYTADLPSRIADLTVMLQAVNNEIDQLQRGKSVRGSSEIGEGKRLDMRLDAVARIISLALAEKYTQQEVIAWFLNTIERGGAILIKPGGGGYTGTIIKPEHIEKLAKIDLVPTAP